MNERYGGDKERIKTTEDARLEPVAEISSSHKKNRGGLTYSCPNCGNPVTRFANKYTCAACRQRLLWPGVDYTEYDERGRRMRAERAARYEEGRHGEGNSR